MGFICVCRFCGAELEAEKSMIGDIVKCPRCHKRIVIKEQNNDAPEDIREQVVTMFSMPPVTFAWAFGFVWKLTAAALLIDGAIALLVFIFVFVFRLLVLR